MKSKWITWMAGLSLALAVTACGSQDAGTQEATSAEAASGAQEETQAETAAEETTQEAAAEETTQEAAAEETTQEAAAEETESSSEEDTVSDVEAAIAERDKTIYFTIDGTKLYLDETLNDVAATGLSFTYHDSASGSDVAVDEAFCETAYTRGNITIETTDSAGNPVSISFWNKWLDEEPETYGELNVCNIGIAEPAPVSWDQSSTGPYGVYVGMSKSDLIAAAGKPESNTQFVKSPTWLYSGDNYSMTVSVSDGTVRGFWIDDTNKVRRN